MTSAAVRPPGPPRRATPNLLRMLFTDRLALMSRAASRYGDAVRIAIGPKQLYLFNHPDYAKHVLVEANDNYRKGIGLAQARRALGDGLLTSEGELWRRQRKAIQPALQQKRIDAQAGVVAAEAGELARRLAARIGGGPVDVAGEVTRMTVGVLGRMLLHADLGPAAVLAHHFDAVQDQAMFEAVTLEAIPSWLPLPGQRRFRAARAALRRLAGQVVDQQGSGVLAEALAGAGGDRAQARDEVITLLLAGHETTASTLGWTMAMLDRHPDVAERVRAEAAQVLGDRLPAAADLHRLVYTGNVVQEVMRLYPPVWLLPRVAVAADRIGGYPVPAGADVVVCPYTLHRHPEFWPDPERFDPDRFEQSRAAGRPRYAYLPFGAGPRFCVGRHLGLMEAVFAVAVLCRDLRLSVVPGHRLVPEAMLSLRIRGGLPMSVRPA
ncbi:cytochrome P450 [Amycolatopsis sp. GA6-003]|uniref:cytochrome P450 n=1 Tax=Amycolatopsis sp. GA6-003 TaxID=2652444 RepID=UPI003916D7E0